MRKIQLIMLILALTLVYHLYSRGKISPFDILDKIDKNLVYTTAYTEVDMVITIKNRNITKTMISYSEGNEKSFVEFLSPVRDKGTKILKVNDIIHIYYPSAERIMRLSGHMLRQSMMGSDFSYEDMTERTTKFKEEYEGEMLADEAIFDHECYVMMLTSKKEKQTYSKGGKLIKVMKVDKVDIINNRYYPTTLTLEDKLRKNSSTTMVIKKIDFDIKLPKGIFTYRNLQKNKNHKKRITFP